MRIYISGPISGVDNYRKPFDYIEDALNAQGFEAVNPCKGPDFEGWSYKDILAHDILRLSTCDAVYMLLGWRESKGAVAEHRFAKSVGMPIVYQKYEIKEAADA